MRAPVYQWETLRDVLTTCLQQGIHVLLYGPPGTGKSYLAKIVAAAANEKGDFLHVSLPEDAMSAEIIGHRVPSASGAWEWQDGPGLKAYRCGLPLVIDEIDHGSAEAQTRLYQILDRTAITLPTSEIVPPADTFVCIATMNGTPDTMNPLYNRFAVRIEIPRPLQSMIDALPPRLQQAAKASWKSTDPNMRQWFALAQLENVWELETAAELLFPGRGAELATALKLGGPVEE